MDPAASGVVKFRIPAKFGFGRPAVLGFML